MPWAQVGHTGEDKHARDVPFLDSYADKQWEVILMTVQPVSFKECGVD